MGQIADSARPAVALAAARVRNRSASSERLRAPGRGRAASKCIGLPSASKAGQPVGTRTSFCPTDPLRSRGHCLGAMSS